MDYGTAALKEWASAIEAFLAGETVMAIRKGGIREETKDFQLRSESFFFFPAYEHQKEHLLKEPFRHYVERTRASWDPGGGEVRIRAWAEVTEDMLIGDEDRLKALSPFHIWTDDYATERLRWKRAKPLHCLLLRVYALEEPVSCKLLPEFNGCKSWISLSGAYALKKRPVLTDEAYGAVAERIRSVLK